MIKILLLNSTWSLSYSSEFIDGIIEEIADQEIQICILNLYDETQRSQYYEKEMDILKLPNVEEFDAAIFSMNSVDSNKLVDNLAHAFADSGKPTISVDFHISETAYVGTDNYASMYALVAHMIEKHNCRNLTYVGGPAFFYEDQERFRAFSDCLSNHNIFLDPRNVRHYRFREIDGAQAYQDFKAQGLALPDAVICANDLMAQGYLQAAGRDGLHAPTDFLITGFDNTYEGQHFLPSITSINRNCKEQGRSVIRYIMHKTQNLPTSEKMYVKGIVRGNESCGCKTNRDFMDDYRILIQNNSQNSATLFIANELRLKLCTSATMEAFQYTLSTIPDLLKAPPLAIALSNDYFNADATLKTCDFAQNMTLVTAAQVNNIDKSTGIVPSIWSNHKNYPVLLYNSLHLGDESFGYSVCPYDRTMFSAGSHRLVNDSLSLSLDLMFHRQAQYAMNKRLQNLYVMDSLTGLYNRYGLEKYSIDFIRENKGSFYILYMDVDNLKFANDQFGHDVGDFVIQSAARAIRNVFSDTSLQVRMGGDEFLVMGTNLDEDTLLQREKMMNDVLKSYGLEKNLPFAMGASIGHIFDKDYPSLNLNQLITEADKKMYEIKQKRKRGQ